MRYQTVDTTRLGVHQAGITYYCDTCDKMIDKKLFRIVPASRSHTILGGAGKRYPSTSRYTNHSRLRT